jgi:hypothetical protein
MVMLLVGAVVVRYVRLWPEDGDFEVPHRLIVVDDGSQLLLMMIVLVGDFGCV